MVWRLMPPRRRGVALLVVHDVAAVGGPAHRHVVQAEAVEDRAGGLDHSPEGIGFNGMLPPATSFSLLTFHMPHLSMVPAFHKPL
jgi:hypothetical protein